MNRKIKSFHNKDLQLIKRALKFIVPYKIKFILALLCILSGIGTGIVQPLFWGRILKYLFQSHISEMRLYILYSLLVGMLTILITYVQSYLFASLNQSIIYDIKKEMYKSLLDLPIKAYDEIDNGEFMSRLHGDANQVASALTGTLLNSVVDLIRLIAIGITVFAISGTLSFIIILSFPISFLIFRHYGNKIRTENLQLSKLYDKYFSDSGEAIWGIREIKSLGIKKYKFNSFIKRTNIIRKKIVDLTLHNAKSQALSNSVSFITQMVVVFIGGLYVTKGILDIQYFIAFYSYSSQFSGSIMNISSINLNLQQVMNSLERIFKLIDGLDFTAEEFGERRLNDLSGNIKFDNVSFGFNSEHMVLNNISLTIPAKSRTAIVGSSGSGKTTMFNLLLKFYTPLKGRILIDEIDINEFAEDALRTQISVVRQEPFLFNMSMKDNLLLAKADASPQEMEDACKRAYIHEYIDSLPEKYNSILGENGINLSGGQRQRIAIARALLKKSKIILFDEATSALDNESQFYIKKAMDSISVDCTVVIIAHRLSTIIEADVIYVVDKGKIVGRGNHQTLIRSNSIYQRLYQSELDIINESCKEVI